MNRVALDWTLSRIWREDLGAPPQKWEQYSREGLIWDLYIVNALNSENSWRPDIPQEFFLATPLIATGRLIFVNDRRCYNASDNYHTLICMVAGQYC